jgi:hypothetical protein
LGISTIDDDGAEAGDGLDEVGLAHPFVDGDLESRHGPKKVQGFLVHAIGDEVFFEEGLYFAGLSRHGDVLKVK